jgi:hypothetical protein
MENSTFILNPYYVPPINNLFRDFRNCFFDCEKKLVQFSVYDTCYPQQLQAKLNLLNSQALEISEVEYISKKVLYVTYWPECYGHILESLFHLHYVANSRDYDDFYVLLNVPGKFPNLVELVNFLFKDRLLNSANFNQNKLIKFEALRLIHNYMMTPNFFKFSDENLSNIIREFYSNDNSLISNEENRDFIFLTRNINNQHDTWSTLINLVDINKFFEKNNFLVIDPQFYSDKKLFLILNKAKCIVTTNGSALCPLITLTNFDAKIFCLNSQRYLPEWRRGIKNDDELEELLAAQPNLVDINFEKNLWRPITSKFNFTYIDSFENKISNNQLNTLLSQII